MRFGRFLALSLVFGALGCRSHPVLELDRPQLTPAVRIIDDSFHSATLDQNMSVRVIVPRQAPVHAAPVVYLLHGAGVNYHDWTNNSRIADFAAKGIVLVLPNMPGSYYINQANGSRVAYENFFLHQLIPEVQRLVPLVATNRNQTAIVGISRGGYGSVTLGLKHPDRFGFVAGISPALDFAERGFRWRTPIDSLAFEKVFGSRGSATRKENDPYSLVRSLQPRDAPFLFLACGDHEALTGVTTRFARIAAEKKLPAELHVIYGTHDWRTWNRAIPLLEASLLKFFGKDAELEVAA